MPKHADDERQIPTVFYRDVTITVDRDALAARAAAGESDDRIPVAISSEAPVERYDWWEGERYYEVLDHAPGSVDLAYARDGLPFLLEHSRGDQHGIIEDVAVDKDRKLRGVVRFSKAARSQEIRQDMLDGIRKKISVGYKKSDDFTQTGGDNGTIPTRRYTKWTPMEASSVSIPADYDVGVGRAAPRAAAGAAPTAPAVPPTPPAPKARSTPVPENEQDAAARGAAADEQVQSRAAERTSADVRVTRADAARGEEVKDIAALAQQHAMTGKLPEWIERGATREDVANEIMAELKERLRRGPQFKPIVGLNEKEEKSYSFVRAINAAASQGPSFEREVSEEIAQNLPQGYKANGGLFIPTNVRMATSGGHSLMKRSGAGLALDTRAGLDSATSSAGAELKQTNYGSFIEMLRNHARVLQAGATMLTGLDGPVTFPKQTSAGTASWMGENPGSAVSLSALATGTVSLSAKTVASQTKFSKQLLRQSSPDAESLVRSDLAAVHALAIDLAAIAGTGASNQPTGILSTSGIGSVAGGTNGLQPTYNHLVGLELKVEQGNANVGPMAYLTTPGIKATLKTTQKFSSTNGESVWTGGEEGLANGYRAFSSNQVPSTLTKGTAAGTCHAILFGVWSQLLIGEWGAMEILADPYTLAGYGMIQVTSFQMVDLAVRYAAAFAAMQDALSASF